MMAADVARIDRSAVEDPDLVGDLACRAAREIQPRIAAQTSWASSGVATRPVPMAQTGSYAMTSFADLLRRESGQRPLDVGSVSGHLAELLPHLEALADADDRDDAARDRLHGLGVDDVVVLAVEPPALGVADHDVAAAKLGQHVAEMSPV